MIEVRTVRKSFGNVLAVDDVSFCAKEGRILGIIGPNGAGKTTTLRMVYSILPPDRGAVVVDGFDSVRDADEVRARIGVLPDARGLYPRLTAREHVFYFGRLHGLSGQILKQRTDELVDRLDMSSFADRRTEGFSAGQRMKVALARALVHRPRNVLLDEPTTGLDVMSTRALRTIVRSLRDEGTAVVLSTHVMQEVSALCDDIVVLAKGRVVAAGTPPSLLEATGKATLEDAFVAAIGTDEGVDA